MVKCTNNADLCYYDDAFNGVGLPFMKAHSIELCADKIKNLVLGSSHGGYGYFPEKYEFNLCFPSQDMYYAFKLYEKYLPKLKNLQNILIFYSIFSPSSDLTKSSENWRCCHYKMAFDIDAPDKEVREFTQKIIPLIENKKDFSAIKNKNFAADYRGENIDVNGDALTLEKSKEIVRKRALSHIKNNMRDSKQNKYLLKLINLAQKNNNNIFVIISPLHKEFKKYLASSAVLFEDLFDLTAKKNVPVLNFLDCNLFNEDDFFDYDHLNHKGSVKLSKFIRDKIKQITNERIEHG